MSPDLYLFAITDSFDNTFAANRLDRTIYASILEKLYTARVKTILWDIMFKDNRMGDQKLINITGKSGNIYYPCYTRPRAENEIIFPLVEKILFIPALQKYIGNPYFIRLETIQYPIEELSRAAAGLGFSNAYPDKDNIQRTIPLFYQSDQGYLPSLVLAAVCDYLQVETSTIEVHYGKHVKLPDALYYGIKKDFIIPIDDKGQMIINFPGPVTDSIRPYPLEKFIEDTKGDESTLLQLLENTFIFVGDISTRGKDFSRGIFNEVYPNSFVLANTINTILTENYVTPSYPIKNYSLFILVIFSVSLFWFISSHQVSRDFARLFLLFYSIIIFLIIGINLLFFIILNNLPQTLELLLGTIISGFILFILKFLYFYVDAGEKDREDESDPVISPNIPPETIKPEATLKAMGIVTKRQLETALLIIEGLTNKEIAKRLFITEYAVKRRAQKIYQKCKVKKRSELIKKVYGILS
jgi:DNA-binding CsgD family transcriptional regulator/CHASE2 domain-containing sensor protein